MSDAATRNRFARSGAAPPPAAAVDPPGRARGWRLELFSVVINSTPPVADTATGADVRGLPSPSGTGNTPGSGGGGDGGPVDGTFGSTPTISDSSFTLLPAPLARGDVTSWTGSCTGAGEEDEPLRRPVPPGCGDGDGTDNKSWRSGFGVAYAYGAPLTPPTEGVVSCFRGV